MSRTVVDIAVALGLALAIFAPRALAEGRLGVILGSYHVESSGWCEVNPGLYVSREVAERVRWGFGAAQNSPCRLSFFTAADVHHATVEGLKLGTRVGLATGYPGSPVSPFVGFTVTKPHAGVDYTVTVVPKEKPVFVFNIEVPFEWPSF